MCSSLELIFKTAVVASFLDRDPRSESYDAQAHGRVKVAMIAVEVMFPFLVAAMMMTFHVLILLYVGGAHVPVLPVCPATGRRAYFCHLHRRGGERVQPSDVLTVLPPVHQSSCSCLWFNFFLGCVVCSACIFA